MLQTRKCKTDILGSAKRCGSYSSILAHTSDPNLVCGASEVTTSQVRAIAVFLLADVIMRSRSTTLRPVEWWVYSSVTLFQV
jgi:hypothetical protein